MRNPFARDVLGAAIALAIAAPLFAAPAEAGGSVALYVAPQNAGQAQLMDFGLRAYAIYNGLKGSGARIDQEGRNNSAGVAQYGSGDVGVITQRGNDHSATLEQSGNANSYGIFQFGRGSSANVRQAGNGNTGAAFTFGW